MDGSNKDNLPAEKLEINYETEHKEVEEISLVKETMLDASLGSPEKQQSKSCLKPKQSPDNVEQESDGNLTCPKIKDTVVAAKDAKKYAKNSTTVTLPGDSNKFIQDVDQPTNNDEKHKTSKEIDSEILNIQASASICSSVLKISESDISKSENLTDSKILKVDDNCKYEEKEIENMSENEATEESEYGKHDEIEETVSKSEKVSLHTPISSPVKRKSQQIAEDKMKRKRITDNVKVDENNDEIVTDSLNKQDSTLYTGPSEKSEEHSASMVVSTGRTTEIYIKEQDVPIMTDQSAIKCKKAASEIDFPSTSKSAVCNISMSNEHFPSEEALLQQEELRGTGHTCPKFIHLEDLENNPEFVQSQKILESVSHQRQSLSMDPESENDKLTKSMNNDPKFKMHSTEDNLKEKLERDKTEHPEIEGTETCPEKELMLDTPVRSPVKRKSESCFEIESKRSAEVEESDDENSTEDELARALKETTFKKIIRNYFIEEGTDLKRVTKSDYMDFRYLLKSIVRECPNILTNYPEQPAGEQIREGSVQEMFSSNRTLNPVPLEQGYADGLPPTLNPIDSPDLLPLENQLNKISKINSPTAKEYSVLAEDQSNVKKDERYLKKNYKQKYPVMLPVDWTGDGASTSKMELNIDFEENKIQFSDEPRIVSEIRDDLHEESHDPKFLKDEDLLKERKSAEDKPSDILKSASEKIMFPIETEKQIEVQREEKDEKSLFKIPEIPKKYKKKSLESNRSKSPKRKSDPQSTPQVIQFEGLAARILPTAIPTFSSDAGPSQPPASDAGPSQPPASDAGPSQPPASDAGPSQPPASDAGRSITK